MASEVGPEGSEANHRTVAENGELGRLKPGDTRPAFSQRRKRLRCLGAPRCVRRHCGNQACVVSGDLARFNSQAGDHCQSPSRREAVLALRDRPALVVLSRKHRRHFRYLPVLIGTVTTAFRFAGLKNLSAVGKRLFLAVFCGSHEMLTSEPK